jgi:penicillin-binding protein 2
LLKGGEGFLLNDSKLVEKGGLTERIYVLFVVVTLAFSILVLKLGWMQLVRGAHYRQISEENRLQLHRIHAPRGLIFDRNGVVLAGNRSRFDVFMVRTHVSPERFSSILKRVGRIIGRSPEWIMRKIEEKRTRPFEPALIATDVTIEKVIELEEWSWSLPGVFIESTPTRFYPDQEVGCHVLGYLNEVSKEELNVLREKGYKMGDMIGRCGVEKVFDYQLRGHDGIKYVETDVLGQRFQVIEERAPKLGVNLILTIDRELQHIARDELGDRTGAVVVMDPGTGEILAMVSSPVFDPNIFVRPMREEVWQEVVHDPKKPLINRCIQATYPPGSTFKIVVATAALENGVVSKNHTFYCPGKFWFGRRYFSCWKEKGHGHLNILDGLVHSCNVFFYQLGLRVGASEIARFAKMYGLGFRTEVEIPGEKRGIIPGPAWKLKHLGEKWYRGETVSFSIGQSFTSVTPLQMVRLISAIGNSGWLYRPFLVKRIVDSQDRVIKEFEPVVEDVLTLSPETLQFLRNALTEVVRRGTGWRARTDVVSVAGKTGTAQNPIGEDHAWFVCFAPVGSDKPEVAVCVLVEHGGHGGPVAAPIAKRIIEAMGFVEREEGQG